MIERVTEIDEEDRGDKLHGNSIIPRIVVCLAMVGSHNQKVNR